MCFFVFVFPPLISQTLTLMATAVHLLVNHHSVFKVPPFMLFIVGCLISCMLACYSEIVINLVIFIIFFVFCGSER